jgi:hypothetical protein
VPASLFEPVEGGWLPTDYSRGPWTPTALHGGPVAALLARTAEVAGDEGNDIGWLPARLTVELLLPVPLEPLRAEGRVVRPGRKVQLVDAFLRTVDGTDVASARLLRVRQEHVPAPVTTAELTPPPPPESAPDHGLFNRDEYDAFRSHGVERAAADFGNGVSRVAEFTELTFINPDLTIHLHRPPAGEWVCIDAVTWMEDQGLALAESRLWDERGPLGRSLQSLLIDRRP